MHFALDILHSPIRELLLAHSPANLLRRETLSLCCWVVTQTGEFGDLLVRDRGCSLAIGALVDCDYDGAAEAEVVLQAVFCFFDQAIVGPAAEVPC